MEAKMKYLPESINYHLIHTCNFHCKYCFAKNYDFKPVIKPMLSKIEMKKIINMIVKEPLPYQISKRKLTFTGGEPLLCPYLHEIIAYAHEQGLITMLVTNGSLLTQQYLDGLKGNLDWLALSIDSDTPSILRNIGRVNGQMTPCKHYIEIARYAKTLGMRIKINTVVNRYNYKENLSNLIQKISPERWKILQVTQVKNQNDNDFTELEITEEQFKTFIERHSNQKINDKIKIIPEQVEDIRGSYVMIDPIGRFFDSMNGEYHFSNPIPENGLSHAFQQVIFDLEKFQRRGGNYAFN
mgnify:CR=1 FL=1